ncbi:hypothetical protein [Phytobacter diazotrophicus]|uniref:hypothetical protein n=1 Tax=Phytobacter diazotrophicus TaxID=395631 RepID=UPI00293704BD|nr:hypothetical protein [Phytobacter diazotrophicus]
MTVASRYCPLPVFVMPALRSRAITGCKSARFNAIAWRFSLHPACRDCIVLLYPEDKIFPTDLDLCHPDNPRGLER